MFHSQTNVWEIFSCLNKSWKFFLKQINERNKNIQKKYKKKQNLKDKNVNLSCLKFSIYIYFLNFEHKSMHQFNF